MSRHGKIQAGVVVAAIAMLLAPAAASAKAPKITDPPEVTGDAVVGTPRAMPRWERTRDGVDVKTDQAGIVFYCPLSCRSWFRACAFAGSSSTAFSRSLIAPGLSPLASLACANA